MPRFTVKHSYNGNGDLQQIKDVTAAEPVPLWFVDERSDEGALTRGTYGNGVQTVRTYDPVSGRLATQDENNGALLASNLVRRLERLGHQVQIAAREAPDPT